jgi:hypothetical protein
MGCARLFLGSSKRTLLGKIFICWGERRLNQGERYERAACVDVIQGSHDREAVVDIGN